MPIKDTEYLSQLSIEEIKAAHKKWPNPLNSVSLIFMCGAFIMGYAKGGYIDQSNREDMVISAIPIFLVIILCFSYLFLKVVKAKKLLRNYSKARSLPPRKVIKEFKHHYNNITKMIKAS